MSQQAKLFSDCEWYPTQPPNCKHGLWSIHKQQCNLVACHYYFAKGKRKEKHKNGELLIVSLVLIKFSIIMKYDSLLLSQ